MTTVTDTFAREVTDGWGSTSSGREWLLSGGAASDRQVSGGAGRVTLAATPGTIRVQRLSRPWTDGEVLAHLTIGQVSETEALLAALCFRRDPANTSNFYRARLVLGTDAAIGLDVTRGTTQVGTRVSTGLTYTAGTRLGMRARVDGHQVRARVWQEGSTEPGTWMVDETITTDPVETGDMGVMISAFSGNTNASPWVEVRRIEVTYDLAVDNRLSGDDGVQVSDATLAASATTGTVTIAAPGARAVYDTVHTVHGLPMVRLESGHHRAGTDTALGDPTPRLLAGTVGTTWAVRVYVRTASLQAAGHGTNEVRWMVDVGGAGSASGLILNETGTGDTVIRVQAWDLATSPVNTPGSAAIALDQLLRVEARCDGTDTAVRIYPGHGTDTFREAVYTGHAWSGDLALTGFRYRIRPTLRLGDEGTAVTALQQDLIALGYDLGAAGADGDFGPATQQAVMDCQSDYGATPVDGEAGPETRATIDLALDRTPEPLYLSHLAVSDGEWIGPAEAPPEPVQAARLVLGMPI
ncbi:peptidoglycan-binding protein [Nocardiopsis sp. FR26]|uniref:peptidoglycan-binding domain-containing protein n=1 Tax=Nocardiopsis sp. FR26 TaxID=2605987 RepID=UPI001356D91C|nr:peptidoglycan-binding domain-containing protein [Nocardiopsis sp. FR26]